VRGDGVTRFRLAGVLAAALNCVFLLARPLGSTLSPVGSFVSELSVPGQPAAVVFRVADLLGGLLLIGFAVGARQGSAGRARAGRATERDRRERSAGRARAGWWGVVAVGLLSLVDAAWPMRCTPSTDAACAAAERSAGLPGALLDVHSLAGIASVLAAVAAMLLIDLPQRPELGRACAAATVVLGAAISACYLFGLPGVGAVQRVQLLVWSGWVALAAVGLRRSAERVPTFGAVGAGFIRNS
jgi:hypothetical protein